MYLNDATILYIEMLFDKFSEILIIKSTPHRSVFVMLYIMEKAGITALYQGMIFQNSKRCTEEYGEGFFTPPLDAID
jgi:hypothetical protein